MRQGPSGFVDVSAVQMPGFEQVEHEAVSDWSGWFIGRR